jgi:hypothetical protein
VQIHNNTRAIAKQYTHAKIEELFEAVSSMRHAARLRKQSILSCESVSCKGTVEVGWDTFTVALRVVGGDEEGTQCPGV